MTTFADPHSRTNALVPLGSQIWDQVPSLDTTDGTWITATNCFNEGCKGPFVWHYLLPLSSGGSVDTANMVSMCYRCSAELEAMIELFKKIPGERVDFVCGIVTGLLPWAMRTALHAFPGEYAEYIRRGNTAVKR